MLLRFLSRIQRSLLDPNVILHSVKLKKHIEMISKLYFIFNIMFVFNLIKLFKAKENYFYHFFRSKNQSMKSSITTFLLIHFQFKIKTDGFYRIYIHRMRISMRENVAHFEDLRHRTRDKWKHEACKNVLKFK